MDGAFRIFIIFAFFGALYFARQVEALVPAEEISEGSVGVFLLTNGASNVHLEEGSPQTSFNSNIEKLNNSSEGIVTNSENNISVPEISGGNLNDLNNSRNISAFNVSGYDGNIVTSTIIPVVTNRNNKTVGLSEDVGKADISDNLSVDKGNISVNASVVNEKGNNSNNSQLFLSSSNSNDNTDNSPKDSTNNNSPVTNIEEDKYDISGPRGDMDPLDTLENEDTHNTPKVEDITPITAGNTQSNFSAVADILSLERSLLYSAMSWLDVFMLEHRGTVWVIFNTIFMVIWILIGGLSLYRLFGLPWCSPYISKTKYLVIHLLIFTAATFEFVQLIHFSYGSHEGLPLFLTLLLTHTPTPCLTAALILTIYCVFVAARVPVIVTYLPPIIYISILISFIIVLSFVGDIIVGVTRNSIVLIVCRVALLVLCLICLLSFIFNYRKIVSVALLMRREFRGELKALVIPVDSVEDSQDAKLHLKRILLTWTRITLLGCISGILMCLFSFCLSLFFTVSFVPLWAFWVLHTAIFVTQVIVVFSITFGAAYTLGYSSRENIFRNYFLPSLAGATSTNRSFIKRGNFIYQRVSVANGPTVNPSALPPTIMENEEHNFLPNNNLVTGITESPFRSKVNLKRSATFNCASPYYGFHRSPCAPFTPNLYPVLSDHILPYSQSSYYPSVNSQDINNTVYNRNYHKPSLQYSNSFSHNIPNRGSDITPYGHRYPLKSFHAKDRFVDLDNVSKGQQKEGTNFSFSDSPSVCITPNLVGMAGTVEPLEVAYAPITIIPLRGAPDQDLIRQIPHNHSFNANDSLHFKPGPPEKPARKTEPVLVKGVIKDNSYIKRTFPTSERTVPTSESIVPIGETFYPDKTGHSYPVKNSNLSPGNAYALRGISPSYHAGLTSRFSPCQESTTTSTPISISKTSFTTVSPSVSPISSQYQGATNSSYDPNISSNNSFISSLSNPPQGSRSNGVCMTVLKDQEEIMPEVHPLMKPEFKDNADISLSTDETHLSVESSPARKRHSLRRNHSTAGDFSAREKANDTEDESTSGEFPQAVNGSKHPWYGTWGGRRKSKRKSSTNGQDSMSSSTLRRLSTSKSSLSSIYEKIKPKRKRATRKQAEADEDDEPTSEMIENSSFSHEEEEEEEFLPRLDEDIDLASDILRSSTVLADFYSLDRSYLKKRKKAQIAEQEDQGSFEMNGVNSVEDSNDNGDPVNDVTIDDKR